MTHKDRHPTTSRNYFYAMIALTALLYLLGILGVVVLYSFNAVTYAREHFPFYIELKDDANDAQVFKFQKELEEKEFVRKGSIRYISETEAMEKLLEGDELKLKKEDIMIFGENLLPNQITFNLKSEYLGRYQALVDDIKSKDFVVDVYLEETVAKNSTINLQRIGLITFFLVIFFIFVAITLIKNTLKLSLYANKATINVLQISGATKEFIMYPYLKSSIQNGLIAGVAAVLCLIFTIFALKLMNGSTVKFISWTHFIVVFVAVLLTGVIVFWFSTQNSLRKYFKNNALH